MEMHIGTRIECINEETGETEENVKASKTECTFFAPPGYFKQRGIEAGVSASNLLSLEESNDESDEKKEKRASIEDKLYDECSETAEVAMIGGFVTYCKHFKYLGSWASYNLRDDYDIEMRIKAASKSFGAMKDFFNRPEVNTRTKHMIFMAIQINLLLWGCESWALRIDLLDKLERFVNRKVRSILNLNMWHVKDQHITTEQLREKFNDILSVQTMIDIKAMKFLGHMVRGPVNLPPRQLLIAYVFSKRVPGRPLKCNKETMWGSLQRLMKPMGEIHIDFVGSLEDWYFDALDKTFWNMLIECLRDISKTPPERPNRDANFNPRRSRRNRTRASTSTSQNGTSPQRSQGAESNSNTPPPRRNQRESLPPSPRENNRDYDPINVGRVMYDSLKIFGLGYGATALDVKTQYKRLARIYHPDKHSLYRERTGMSDNEAEEFFKLIANAKEYLMSKL